MYLIEATVGVVDKPRNSPMRTVVSRNNPFTAKFYPIVAALSVHVKMVGLSKALELL